MARRVSVVLGIDAAWTARQPSGVALVRSRGSRWECVAVAPSYASFVALADTSATPVRWTARPQGGLADCVALHRAAIRLAGAPPDVIAIDMPLSTCAITARRVADNAIASAYARRGLGAHSPSAERPGPIADAMRAGFAALGYSLACTTTAPASAPVMIEVFPHATAIALVGADYRVPYKLARIAQYWPELDREARRRALLAQWTKLRRAIDARIAGVDLRVPARGTLAALKRYEDVLDALLCAWTGVEYLAGNVRPYGDASGAVWAA